MHRKLDRQTFARRPTGQIALAMLLLAPVAGTAQPAEALPTEIERLLDADPLPQAVIDPTRQFILLVQQRQLLALESLAEPAVEIAGRRIDLQTAGAHAPLAYYGLSLIDLATGREERIALPRNAVIGYPGFAPNGSRFAFTVTRAKGTELWIGESNEARARPLLTFIDAARGPPCVWTGGSRRLLCRTRISKRPSETGRELDGLVQTTPGQPAVLSDVLTRDLLESQLVLVDSISGQRHPIGAPAAFESVSPAPAGAFLLVTRMAQPYPRISGVDTVQRIVEIWDRFGRVRARLPESARAPGWHAGELATLAWVERKDGVDRLVYLRAPYTDEPSEAFALPHRFSGLRWLATSRTALVSDYDAAAQETALWRVAVGQTDEPQLVSRNSSAFSAVPLTETNRLGQSVVVEFDGGFYLRGTEAGNQSRRNFLEHVSLETGERRRVWTGAEEAYENLLGLLETDASVLLTRYESRSTTPNYFIRHAEGRIPLTDHAHPAPLLRNARFMRLEYQRKDGLALAASLYLPPDYKGLERLPLVVWAYPRRVSSGGTDAIVAPPAKFMNFERAFRLFFLLRGYAVLDDVSMPIVGENANANDTFIAQIIDNAEAAIEAAASTGFIARERVGVAGHSYGAFMVANLLAHSDLFSAGVALSGAYNRTLTPFGFQTERRTLWEAPGTYLAMSPLLYSHQIAAPMLLVHGLNDDNAGTSPLQSTEFYQAIRGNGGEAELLLLPWEGHSYRARESVFKTAARMLQWFDRHLSADDESAEKQTGALLRP